VWKETAVKSRVHFKIGKLFALTIMMIWISNGQPPFSERTDLQTIIASLDSSAGRAHSDGRKIVFMLRFIDFGCQPCLQNFFELCDSFGTIQRRSLTIPVYLLFLRDKTGSGYQLTTMTKWARSCGLQYPIALISQKVFHNYGIEHSSVLIMNKNGTIENCGEIPLSRNTFKNILRMIDT
jgi:hypothetical protein